MTLGMTDGTKLCGASVSSNYYCMEAYPGNYGKDVGSANSTTGGLWAKSKTVGITTDQEKSGIVADLSSGMSAVIKY